MSSEFSEDWKEYLSGSLNRRIIAYLEDRFKRRGIEHPELKHIQAITLDELINSRYPLSMLSVQELALFIQKIDSHEKEHSKLLTISR